MISGSQGLSLSGGGTLDPRRYEHLHRHDDDHRPTTTLLVNGTAGVVDGTTYAIENSGGVLGGNGTVGT